MSSAWILTRETKSGRRFRVLWRAGGRDTPNEYGGSFATKAEALERKKAIAGELAALRDPRALLARARAADRDSGADTLRAAAKRWQSSRVDVSDGTAQTYKVALGRLLPRLGDRPVDELDAQTVADLVAELHAAKLRKQTIRKTVSVLAMVLDHERVHPNPARDRLTVKLPREEAEELTPPTAAHVEAVFRLLPSGYRLPLIVLDAAGMRISELELLQWGDLDEPDARWRIRRAATKTRRARWVPFAEFPARPLEVFRAVVELVPREDRALTEQVFAGFSGDAFRTSLAKACKAAAVPLFSPNDLRHRRATLWHLQGVPAVQAAAWLGHSPIEHVRTYAHATLADRSELDYTNMLERARTVGTPVGTSSREIAG